MSLRLKFVNSPGLSQGRINGEVFDTSPVSYGVTSTLIHECA